MISIIIPAYNSESTISRIIDSVIKQTYLNWELLIIDDGSVDRTSIICQSYVEKDQRIRLYYQDNQGVSSARNMGIEHSSGQFITFIDSDDNISEFYISDLYDDYQINGCPDLVCHGYITINLNGKKKFIGVDESILITKGNRLDLLQNSVFKCFMSSCTKLFKMDIIKNNTLRFDTSLEYGEDTIFTLNYIKEVEKIYISNKANYYYILRSDSATQSFCPYDSLLLSCDRMLGATNILLTHLQIPTYYILYFITDFYGWLFWVIFKSTHKYDSKKDRILKISSMPPIFFIGARIFLQKKGVVGKFISLFLYGKLPVICDFVFVGLFKIENRLFMRKIKKRSQSDNN